MRALLDLEQSPRVIKEVNLVLMSFRFTVQKKGQATTTRVIKLIPLEMTRTPTNALSSGEQSATEKKKVNPVLMSFRFKVQKERTNHRLGPKTATRGNVTKLLRKPFFTAKEAA